MKHEPPIDRTDLMNTIHKSYGITIAQLDFVPLGFAAVCYVAHFTTGQRWFLKLWPNAGSSTVARQAVMLRVMRELYRRELFTSLPVPLSTCDNRLLVRWGAAALAMFPLLPGYESPEPLPKALQREWARTIARIHRATPGLGDVLSARETFTIPFEPALRRALAQLPDIDAQQRPGLQALRDLVLPRKAEIEHQLAWLHQLRSAAVRVGGPLVLCHTDAGSQNLLLDGERLFVLDWDDARLAPPEHDLHEARFMDLANVLNEYTAAGGAQPLAVEHFAFYLLRRHLGDMWERMRRVLEVDASADRDRDALDGIEAWGFEQWAALPETVRIIQEALDSLQ